MSEPPESLTPADLAAALVFGLQFDGRAERRRGVHDPIGNKAEMPLLKQSRLCRLDNG